MVANLVELLAKRAGRFEGEGVNHEGQWFKGTLEVSPVVDGKGVAISFCAIGKDGACYHKELSIIADDENAKCGLWTVSTNIVCFTAFKLQELLQENEQALTAVFTQVNQQSPALVEITIDLWHNRDISYRYAWNLPGEAIKPRSSVRMQPISVIA